jgi:hypothetical protein
MSITVAWEGLSAEGAWRVTNLGLPISYGLSVRELAVQLGEPAKWIDVQLELLRAQLVRLAD